MSVKQFKVKYSGSMLGIWWAIIIPLILAASINFVFTYVFKIGIGNFTLFVLSGIIPWLFFSNTVFEVTNSFIANSSVLRQAVLPPEIIPISCVVANSLSFLIGFIVLLPIFIFSKPVVIKSQIEATGRSKAGGIKFADNPKVTNGFYMYYQGCIYYTSNHGLSYTNFGTRKEFIEMVRQKKVSANLI